MEDFYIDATEPHLNACKDSDFQVRVIERFNVFISFLQDNQLVKKTILKDGEKPNKFTMIMRSDLTDEGYEVIKKGYDKWLDSLNRGRPIDDVSILLKTLNKIRS